MISGIGTTTRSSGDAAPSTQLFRLVAAGAAALNPLYGFDEAPFSDAFLAIGLALVVAFRLQTSASPSAG